MRLPALAFIFGGRSVTVWRDESAYADATGSQLRGGFFRTPFIVVDADLVRWSVTGVSTFPANPGRAVLDAVFNRPRRIRLNLERAGVIELQELKDLVSRALSDDPTGIWSGGESSPDEIARKIEERSSHAELVDALS